MPDRYKVEQKKHVAGEEKKTHQPPTQPFVCYNTRTVGSMNCCFGRCIFIHLDDDIRSESYYPGWR
jgi:hypothetical protein